MAPRSARSKAKAKLSVPTDEDVATDSPTLPPTETNPLHVLILPENASDDARIVSLCNPASGNMSRYFYCPQNGLYELVDISDRASEPSSWLLAPERNSQAGVYDASASEETVDEPRHGSEQDGYILRDSRMVAAMPYDPMFFWLPILIDVKSGSEYALGAGLAHTLDEQLSRLGQTSNEMKQLLERDAFVQLMESRLDAICEIKDAEGETAYRLDPQKLYNEVMRKAMRMTDRQTWPHSLETAYVQKQLEAPAVVTLERQTSNTSAVDEATDGASDSAPHESAVETAQSEVISLLRLRVATNYIYKTYMPTKVRNVLKKVAADSKSENHIDYRKLDSHLEKLKELKEEAHALQSMSDNISRKRTAVDDEQEEIRAEKRRKKEEDERRKKAETRSLKELKKVDTTGMKKLSSFFAKAVPKKT